ncbi:SDR family NAD(P)-dependent oxidoreductase [Amycolatopsis sp. DSM 110486]|uniref:SDR family NAD(P)-dependent oxidoreductase n=1 Tax=Amycolatopsis sp. DSM 110486 TaxID=2865832 RepID=UPI001C6A5DD5|nr:SDR family oxidoreductase [Amycolatopsis sp. DSM 110486]QYN18731.1 SDR family oxidoreductase [Amycolatopsis sp. DSM 110486]
MSDLKGRVAVVTGAASGIGRAIALCFADAGAQVVVADRQRDAWHGGAPTDELAEGATFVECDLADPAAVAALIPAVAERHGRLDVLVNNAATSVGRELLETTDDDWHQVLAVNLTAPFVLSRAAVRQMLTQEPRGEVRGRIVNVTSQHGIVAAREDTAYGVSKAALSQLTRQIAAEYAERGVVCNAVAPGKIETGPSARAGEPAWLEYWTSRTPWPRLGRPEDVARAALFLAGDDATYLTGTTLMVDGGWTAR